MVRVDAIKVYPRIVSWSAIVTSVINEPKKNVKFKTLGTIVAAIKGSVQSMFQDDW